MKLKHLALALLSAVLPAALPAGDSVRPGLEPLEEYFSSFASQTEEKLVMALKQPLLDGKDVQLALQKWFDGRLLDQQGNKPAADQAWAEGLKLLDNLQPLPQPVWKGFPEATFTPLKTFKFREYPGVEIIIVEWTVDKLKQYGVLITPPNAAAGDRYPVILYAHGAAFGVPESFLEWLIKLAMRGYVIVGPAMRGEPLFQRDIAINGKILKCEGEIENLEGEVNDCLSMLNAAWKLPYVEKGSFAMIGHSFGSGVGLVTAARAGEACKAVVSYDAWLVNPQRFYWDRMARGANNWLSWADFCNQPVKAQLAGLMTRSIVHNADKLKAKLLFFIGGGYQGSVFHLSHDDLMRNLDRLHIPYTYKVMPQAGHNFVLYTDSEPALAALKIQTEFLDRTFPPYRKNPPAPADK